MKKCMLFLAATIALASCSTPKYTYYFDHYNYAAGKKNPLQGTALETKEQEYVLAIDERTLTASAKESEVFVAEPASVESTAITKEEAVSRIKSMSKEERNELKREAKRLVKQNKKEVKSSQAITALDNDVKLASIFGAVGIVLLIIGGDVLYVLGAIALLVGLYFFIRWLIHQ
ncbi:MAG: hypothetical protein WAZ98_14740 [Cyclobacteriaceae bacterium]